MPEALVSSTEAIDRLLDMLRTRLETAFVNGQSVKMDAREGTRRNKVSTAQFGRMSLREMIAAGSQLDGSFDFHLYIGPKE